jgi:1-acyl-sn-glycerol-3-phosphate acyltransferase
LQRFHDGAFRLAAETGNDIIPTLIFNTRKVLPSNKTFFFWPYKVEMHFLPAVPVLNKTAQQLKEEVFAIMETYYTQHQ